MMSLKPKKFKKLLALAAACLTALVIVEIYYDAKAPAPPNHQNLYMPSFSAGDAFRNMPTRVQ